MSCTSTNMLWFDAEKQESLKKKKGQELEFEPWLEAFRGKKRYPVVNI